MTLHPLDPDDALAALERIKEVQRDLALKATNCPLWRHAAFAAIMAMLVFSQGFGPRLQIPAALAALVAIVGLSVDDRRRYGLFINGYRRGRTLPVSLTLVAALLGAGALEIWARVEGAPLLLKLGISVGAFVAALGASVAWNRAYRRELTDRPG